MCAWASKVIQPGEADHYELSKCLLHLVSSMVC